MSSRRNPPWRTDAREAELRRMWAASASTREIFAALQAMPGPEIAHRHEITRLAQALRLGVRPANTNRPMRFGARPNTPTRCWTTERTALLVAEFATVLDLGALLAQLNALLGTEQVRNIMGIRNKAAKLGLRRQAATLPAKPLRAPAAPPKPKPRPVLATPLPPALPAPPPSPPRPEPSPERADAVLARRHDRARALLARRNPPEASEIATTCALPLREVLRLRAEVRDALRHFQHAGAAA